MAKAAQAQAANAEQKDSRNRGITSGLRIYEYQNQTLEQNVKNRFTDEQLASMWRKEFPRAMEFTDRMVRTVRSLYNKGKHKNDVPAQALVGYDENRKPLPAPTRGRQPGQSTNAQATSGNKAQGKAQGKTTSAAASAPKLKLRKAS